MGDNPHIRYVNVNRYNFLVVVLYIYSFVRIAVTADNVKSTVVADGYWKASEICTASTPPPARSSGSSRRPTMTTAPTTVAPEATTSSKRRG